MEKKDVLDSLANELLPKIHGFCRLKLGADDEAEDLAQDICAEVLRSVRKGAEIENLPAFVWKVSNRQYYNWLRKKKRRSGTVSINAADFWIPAEDDIEAEIILREQVAILRRELAHLTGMWREATVLYYFDGLTVEKISAKLGRSPGTVKWWLHQAREELGKGLNSMREYGEKSYRPGRLTMSCQGNPGADGEPMRCAERRIAQNILLAAYRKPLSVEELCAELGVSAPYVEDEVDYLTRNELMKEGPKGKYRTDFVILSIPDPAGPPVVKQIRNALFPAFHERTAAFLEANREILTSPRFNRPGWTWERLLWVYIHAAVMSSVNRFCAENGIRVDYSEMPYRPNGGRWIALGFDNSEWTKSADAEEWAYYDGPVQKGGGFYAEGFFHAWSGPSSTPFFDLPDAVFALSADLIEGRRSFDTLEAEEKYTLSLAVEKKLWLRREDGSFALNFYYIDLNTDGELAKILKNFYPDAEPLIGRAWELIRKTEGAGIPAELRWQSGNFLANALNPLVTMCLHDAYRDGRLSEPDDNNRAWLSLFVTGVQE